MSRILICTPYRQTTHPALLERWDAQAAALGLDTLRLPDSGAPWLNDGRFSAHARARNAVLEDIDLGAYDYLFWVDIDLVVWPAELLDWALTHNPDGVTAPAVVLDRYIDRFYDTWGFLEAGRPAALYPPWFQQAGSVVTLDSVGCCYLIPAAVYRDGARYGDTPGATEHLSVMRACQAQGRRVVANLELRAVHAYLPEYGEALH